MKRIGLLILLGLGACAQPVVRTDETSAAPLPAQSYLDVADDSRVFQIDPLRSLILVAVGRDGPAAGLGHDHAIASEAVQGYVEFNEDNRRSRADLAFALRELIVDKPEYRRRLQLDSEPSERDIAGTYANMLKVVMPDEHPWVSIHAAIAAPGSLSLSVTLAGRSVDYTVPATIEGEGCELRIIGQTTISHADFGLSSYSAVGGLLRVADELGVSFDIVAECLADTAAPQ